MTLTITKILAELFEAAQWKYELLSENHKKLISGQDELNEIRKMVEYEFEYAEL